MRESATTML
jgi:hypothetical protein